MVFCILLRKEGVVNDNCDTMRDSESVVPKMALISVLTLLGLFVRKIVSDYLGMQFAFLISPSPIPKNPL